MVFPEARDDLFRTYILTYLKLKIEASDPPESDAEADLLIARYLNEFGLVLDKDELMKPKNAIARAIAKFMLNSLWGKFGENEHAIQKLMKPEAFHKFMTQVKQGKYDLKAVYVNEHLDEAINVEYTSNTDRGSKVLCRTNVAIAAYITALGRMWLYRLMNQVMDAGGRVFYCDTDSVIFGSQKKLTAADCDLFGDTLGMCSDEAPMLKNPKTGVYERVNYTHGAFVLPKVYSLGNPEFPDSEIVACKGMSRTVGFHRKVNFDSLVKLTQPTTEGLYEELVVGYPLFMRQRNGDIFIGEGIKGLAYNPTDQKMLRRSDGYMIPFQDGVNHRPEIQHLIDRAERGTPISLPKKRYEKRRKLGDCDLDDTPDGLTDAAAEELHRLTIEEQDRHRVPLWNNALGLID